VKKVIRLGDPFIGAFVIHSDSYLYLSRHNIYYYRAIVPHGIRGDLHKREYRRSMQTRNLRVAQAMARALRVCFEELLEGMRLYMVTWEELRSALDKRLDQMVKLEQEDLRVKGPYPVTADDIWKFNTIPNFERAIEEISASRSDSLASGRIPEFARKLAEELLKESNLSLDHDSDIFTKFCEATVRMYLDFTKQRVVLNDEARSFRPSVGHPISPPSYTTAEVPRLISNLIEAYCREMASDKRWSPKSERDFRGSYTVFLKIVNDRPISTFNRDVARFYKESLQKLPSNMSKKPQYRNLSISELLAVDIPLEDRLSASKVNLDLGRVSALFNWAVGNDYITKNPFSGLKVKDDVDDQDKRYPFDNEDLQALFGSSLYLTGKFLHPHYYWLPLLGLYTGARIDELCQLHLNDFVPVGDLWVISINSDGEKKLKNKSSRRKVPVHSRLIALGLLDYISSLKKKKEVRLFPEVKRQRDGYSQGASKWFKRYRVQCKVTDDRKTFHSFRHTLIDALKLQNTVTEEKMDKIATIVGHKIKSMTGGHYGKPYEPAILAPLIETLDFPIEVPKWKV
jgi:integrase